MVTDSFENVELIADYACEIGENPLWHSREKKLYWTDIPTGRLFRFDPATETHEQVYQGRPVGGFTIQEDDSLLLFMDRGTIAIWNNGLLTSVVPELEDELDSRFNDVIADPCGRVFCGTMATSRRNGRLYRLDLDGKCRLVLENVGCSNGMAFSPDRRCLYHTDSFAYTIHHYDYDIETGGIANRRVFRRFDEGHGMPDGSTLDQDGKLWTAVWDGHCFVRHATSGLVEQTIPVPAKKVSSLTFGGDDYGDIYITTAGGNSKAEDGELAGALFRMKSKARGVPEFRSRIHC